MFRNGLIGAFCIVLLLGSGALPTPARAGLDHAGGTPPAPGSGATLAGGGQVFTFPAGSGPAAGRPALNDPHLVASGLGQPPVLSAAGIPEDDRENSSPVSWYVYEHQTLSDIISTVTVNGLRVVDLYVEDASSPAQMSAVYVANTASYARNWSIMVDATPADLYDYATTNNYRIVVLKAFDDPAPGADVRFFAILIANTGADAKTWWFYDGLTPAQVTTLWQANTARLVQVNSYVKGGVTLYAVVMISNTGSDARSWWWYVDATQPFISSILDSNNARLTDLDIDQTTGHYNVIMNSCSGGCPAWWWYIGVSTANLLSTASSNGARIIDANSTAGCGDRGLSIVLIDNSVKTLTLDSIPAQDGQVLETSETSGVGGALNSTAPTFRLGDSAAKQQYRGILSFDTSGLPDTAIITSVTLKLKQSAIVGGGNPLAIFQGLMLDIKKGFFGTTGLEAGDFQAAASHTVGPFSPAAVSTWYSVNLTGAKAYINKLATNGGLTQLRLRFQLDDNNDALANTLNLFSGNAAAANRPQLIIRYYVP